MVRSWRPKRWLLILEVLIGMTASASADETCLFSGTADYGGRIAKACNVPQVVRNADRTVCSDAARHKHAN